MEIYLDYLFIENFCMSVIILFETGYLIRKKTSKRRIIIASIFSALYVCIMLVLKIEELDYVISKILINTIVIYIAFKIISLKQYLKTIIVFFTVTSVNIGANIFVSQMFNLPINSLTGKVIVYLGGLFMSYIIFKWLWKIYKQDTLEKNCLYEVIVKIGGKNFEYKGFLDTGNNLREVTINKYVIFARQKDQIEKYVSKNKNVEVDVYTIAGKEKLIGNLIENIEIRAKYNKYVGDAIIVFGNSEIWENKNFDMILNYELLKEMGGVRI